MAIISTAAQTLAPGARIVVRDTQWIVTKVEKTSSGFHLLYCVGQSEIVRDKEARFLTSVDKEIEVLDPTKTKLVIDTSPQFRDSFLYIESLLRSSVPTDDKIYIGHQAVMDSMKYQLEPAALALKQVRQRILIADAVGLGKTLECGILLTELIRRGRGRRILVVTVKSMMTQFAKELWARFSIPLTRLDSYGISRVQSEIPTNQNPFYCFDRSIISIDTLKDDRYQEYIRTAWWDVIIIDEAHNVAARGSKQISKRAKLAINLLSSSSDTLILLSATPHDGSAQSFASLMNMLDPTAIADEKNYTSKDIRGLFVRRFKKDIQEQAKDGFKQRKIHQIVAGATEAEEAVFAELADLGICNERIEAGLPFGVFLEKSFLSSAEACLQTVQTSEKNLMAKAVKDETIQAVLKKLTRLHVCLENVINQNESSKIKRLIEILTDPTSNLYFTGKEKDDRLVIFTERIKTLELLAEKLPKALGLSPDKVKTLRGTDSDIEQQAVVEAFGKEEDSVRLLIATDVASEGINLHYLCNKLIHFDVPWSFMLFQQRNGRIDRYGQSRTPHIVYMTMFTLNEKIAGDLHIIDLLIEKQETAQKNLGDIELFFNRYDVKKEENLIAQLIAQGKRREDVERLFEKRKTKISQEKQEKAEPTQEKEDLLLNGDILTDCTFSFEEEQEEQETAPAEEIAPTEETAPTEEPSVEEEDCLIQVTDNVEGCLAEASEKVNPVIGKMPSLYKSDFHFAKEALRTLALKDIQVNDREEMISFSLTSNQSWVDDLHYLLRQFPREIRQVASIDLCADKEAIQKSIALSHGQENAWPKLQYLWEMHPLLSWLSRKVSSRYRRNEAPVIVLPKMPAGENIFLVSGLLPNRKGHPVIDSWFVWSINAGKVTSLSFDEFLKKIDFSLDRPYANEGASCDIVALEKQRASIVERTKKKIIAQAADLSNKLEPKLKEQEERLQELKNRRVGVLGERYEKIIKEQEEIMKNQEESEDVVEKRQRVISKANERLKEIEAGVTPLFAQREEWIRDTLKLEKNSPYIRIVAVFAAAQE